MQESLTNALRYAGPASVTVVLRYQAGQLVVEVADDGSGPGRPRRPPAGLTDSGRPNGDAGSGHGIIGMRERAVAVGGTLHAGARDEGGFAVRACLPLEPVAR